METTFLTNTGVQVSKLAFGTMSFGGDADFATSKSLFGACRDAGVNLFDCADIYNRGRSEEILGELIAPCRDEIVLTSKAYFPTSRDPNAAGASRFHLTRAVEASLRRLKTDRIDLYFIHRFDECTDLEQTLRALETLVQQGKILYPALSNFAAWQTQKALGIAERHGLARPVCVQPMYNLVKRQAEVEILPQAQAEQVAVMPYSPLAGGLLSGKYGPDRRPDQGRLTSNAMYQARYRDRGYYEVAQRFTEFARERDLHPATLAVAWVAQHPAVTAPILGARNVDQLGPCLAAAELQLDADTYAALSALSPEPPPATDRNEEGGEHDALSRRRP